MQHKVHSTDSQHRLVGVEAVEHIVAEMVVVLLLHEFGREVFFDIFSGFNDKAGTTHSGVADSVVERGPHKRDHHADNVSWRAELTVFAACRHLSEDILIDVAHSVAVVHFEGVDSIDNFHQSAWRCDKEVGITHKSGVSRIFAAV